MFIYYFQSGISHVMPHCAVFCPCVLASIDRFGIDTKRTIYDDSSILAFLVVAMKEKVLTVNVQRFSGYDKVDDFEVGKPGHCPTSGYISKFIHTISGESLAYSEDSYEICHEVAA